MGSAELLLAALEVRWGRPARGPDLAELALAPIAYVQQMPEDLEAAGTRNGKFASSGRSSPDCRTGGRPVTPNGAREAQAARRGVPADSTSPGSTR